MPDWATKPVDGDGRRPSQARGSDRAGVRGTSTRRRRRRTSCPRSSAPAPTQYAQGGLLDTAKAMNMSPYQILTVGVAGAAGIQAPGLRQGGPGDLQPACTRHRTLEFDSTVNYSLDRKRWPPPTPTAGSRRRGTPMCGQGLPATPICSPGAACAGRGRTARADGDWLYFVTIDLQGTTLFTRDYPQHLANIELAKRNGVLDSAPRSPRKAAVLGSPIAHSRSPQLHLAAYRALGLDGWTYDRIECTADELPGAGRRFRPGMGGRVGDDARQVRRAAVRRRTHRSARNWSARPTLWCGRRRAGVPTTPTSTA